MDKYNHKFKKKFGQNFLNNENIINKIVTSAEIEANSLVIEIGPGAGALTKKLAQEAKQVLAYEIDLDLQVHLTELFKDKDNVDIIWEDFLKRDIKKDIENYDCTKIYVIANIPYYITTPIIEKLIESKIDLEKIVLMVQKEVGDRFSAKPNTKDYSSITVFLNYYFNIKKLFIVGKNNFYPKPNVDSIIISLNKKEEKYEVKDEEKLFKLIRDSFQFKRKNIKNNLKNYNLEKVEAILKKYGKDLNSRAETLDLEVFCDISNNL